jgi:hypothetical protein
MSENNDTQPEVEKTTETVTERTEVPHHEDKREELRTGDPQIVRETETVTERDAADAEQGEDPDGDSAA